MINYFLKSNSNIEGILEENSINFCHMNIGGTTGVVIDQSSILYLKKILNRIYMKDIDLNNVRNTNYQGLGQVFVFDFGLKPGEGVYNTDGESLEDVEAEIDDLTEDINSIDSDIDELTKLTKDIDELTKERELLVNKINMLREQINKTESINVGTKKETQEFEGLFKYDDTIIL